MADTIVLIGNVTVSGAVLADAPRLVGSTFERTCVASACPRERTFQNVVCVCGPSSPASIEVTRAALAAASKGGSLMFLEPRTVANQARPHPLRLLCVRRFSK